VETFRCATVETFRCATVETFRCATVETFRRNCAPVETFRCATVETFRCATVETFRRNVSTGGICLLFYLLDQPPHQRVANIGQGQVWVVQCPLGVERRPCDYLSD
jgi:hypothetical protein